MADVDARKLAGQEAWAKGSPELKVAQDAAIKNIADAANFCAGRNYASLTGDEKTKYEESHANRQLRLEPFFVPREALVVVQTALKNRVEKEIDKATAQGKDTPWDPQSYDDVKGVRQVVEKPALDYETKEPIVDSYLNVSLDHQIRWGDLDSAHQAVIESKLAAAGMNADLLPSNNKSKDVRKDSDGWRINSTIDANFKNTRLAGDLRPGSKMTNSNGDKSRIYPTGTPGVITVGDMKDWITKGEGKGLTVWKYSNQHGALSAAGVADRPLAELAGSKDPAIRGPANDAVLTAFIACKCGLAKVGRTKGADGRDAPTLLGGRMQLGADRPVGNKGMRSGLIHEIEKTLSRNPGDSACPSLPIGDNGKVSTTLSPNSMTIDLGHTSGGIVLGTSVEKNNQARGKQQDKQAGVGQADTDMGL